MDPLSDVLELLKLSRYGAGAYDLGGAWALSFTGYRGVKCYAVASGECWFTPSGGEARRLGKDDCVLLARGTGFSIGARPGVVPLPSDIFFHAEPGKTTTINGGGDCLLVGGHFLFEHRHTPLLDTLLPSASIVRGDQGGNLLGALDEVRRELQAPRPGSRLAVDHLAHLILLYALRLQLSHSHEPSHGILAALADRHVAAAIQAVHADPAAPWTLKTLAAEAHLSRTVFVERFRATMGASPISYVTRWRMQLAARRIAAGDRAVAEIARDLGYRSESAFRTAFRREIGVPPRQHRLIGREVDQVVNP